MDIPDLRQTRWTEMMRYFNRVQNLKPDRLPRIVLEWEKSYGGKQWLGEIAKVAQILHLPPPMEGIQYDLEAVQSAALQHSRDNWWREAEYKPKLRMYRQVRTVDDEVKLCRLGLQRQERSLVAKLLCGVLPLEIETGRFVGKPVAERLCKVCNTINVEDEFHFLFSCCMYQRERSNYYVENIENIEDFMLMEDGDKVRYMLQKEHVKNTGAFIKAIYHKRRQILYNINKTTQ